MSTSQLRSYDSFDSYSSGVASPSMALMGKSAVGNSAYNMGSVRVSEVAPQPNVTDRKVVTNSQVSLLVLKVKDTIDKIQDETTSKNGYAVQTYISTPVAGETGYIVVRIPADKLKDFLKFLRTLAVRVVNENIQGTDVTDTYVDSQARLDRLYATKAKVEEILSRTVTVDEILRVQQQIFSLQDQIDSIKGQLQYLDATSKTSLVTINVSTDELSLPYAPEQPWRPEVIAKQASRSMIGSLRSVGSAFIWFGVYSVIWAPALLVFILAKRFWKIRHKQA